jgi:hypothetical protein
MTTTAERMQVGLPDRMKPLPVDQRGYPVPWFVTWIDGVPDFRVITPEKVWMAHRIELCWVCGQPRGRYMAFVIGPMCSINRVSSEPPSHRDCAIYSAVHCPFLTKPNMHRRENALPEGHIQPAGVMIRRNPGVTMVWITRDYRAEVEADGILFRIGDPVEVLWYAEGRPATRDEVVASVESGLPTLIEMADAEGPAASAALARMQSAAEGLWPVR